MGCEQPVTLVKDDWLCLFGSTSCRDRRLSGRSVPDKTDQAAEAFKPKPFASGPDPAVK
jgi:hypothetical protein